MSATTRRDPTAAAIVLAAGTGGRGTFAPAWALAAGRPVCAWAVDALDASPHVSRVALVADAGRMPRVDRLVAAAGWRNVRPISPAADAADLGACLRAGLVALADAPTDGVVLHDSARPMLTTSLLDALVAQWDGTSVVAAASSVKETLKVVDGAWQVRQTPPRDRLWQLHPPLLLSGPLLEHVLATLPAVSGHDQVNADITALIAHAPGVRLRLVPMGHDDLVVRRRTDLRLVERMLPPGATTR